MKKTVMDQIEITRDGYVQVRMRKIMVDEEGVEHTLGYHRTSFTADVNVDKQFDAVNESLKTLNAGSIHADELAILKKVTAALRAKSV